MQPVSPSHDYDDYKYKFVDCEINLKIADSPLIYTIHFL
jgi:hypothetical protein